MYARARVCVPPWHMGADGHSFDFVFNHQQNSQQHFCRGTEGVQGSSVQRSSPLRPRKTYLHCLRLGPVVGSWRGTHLRSSFISFRATSFLGVWRSKGPKPHPLRIISFCFVLYAIPAVWRTWYQNFHFIFVFHYHHHPHHSAACLFLRFCSSLLFSTLLPNPSV